MQTAARAGASGSACGSRRAPTGPALPASADRLPGSYSRHWQRDVSPAGLCPATPPSASSPRNSLAGRIAAAALQPGAAPRTRPSPGRTPPPRPLPPPCRESAAGSLPPRPQPLPCGAGGGDAGPVPQAQGSRSGPAAGTRGRSRERVRGGNDPGAHARRALQRCMTRALQHHQQPGWRSHRLPAPGRRAPAAELFLVRSRGRARRRWHRRLLSARAARRTPLLAVSCSRGAPRPWRARAARASRSVFSARPRLRYAAAGSCSCLLTALPRSARPGVCPRPAPSATAARAPPPAPALG